MIDISINDSKIQVEILHKKLGEYQEKSREQLRKLSEIEIDYKLTLESISNLQKQLESIPISSSIISNRNNQSLKEKDELVLDIIKKETINGGIVMPQVSSILQEQGKKVGGQIMNVDVVAGCKARLLNEGKIQKSEEDRDKQRNIRYIATEVA